MQSVTVASAAFPLTAFRLSIDAHQRVDAMSKAVQYGGVFQASSKVPSECLTSQCALNGQVNGF